MHTDTKVYTGKVYRQGLCRHLADQHIDTKVYRGTLQIKIRATASVLTHLLHKTSRQAHLTLAGLQLLEGLQLHNRLHIHSHLEYLECEVRHEAVAGRRTTSTRSHAKAGLQRGHR